MPSVIEGLIAGAEDLSETEIEQLREYFIAFPVLFPCSI